MGARGGTEVGVRSNKTVAKLTEARLRLISRYLPVIVKDCRDVLARESVRRIGDQQTGFTNCAIAHYDAFDVLHTARKRVALALQLTLSHACTRARWTQLTETFGSFGLGPVLGSL
jgi:hypothetical protein